MGEQPLFLLLPTDEGFSLWRVTDGAVSFSTYRLHSVVRWDKANIGKSFWAFDRQTVQWCFTCTFSMEQRYQDSENSKQ